MATIRLTRHEVERSWLPRICALTGEETDDVKSKSFTWAPRWTYVLLVGGVLPCLVVRLILTKRMTVEFPLRPGKHGHWMVRQLCVGLGLVAAFLLMVVGGVASGSRNPDEQSLSTVCLLVALVAFVATLVIAVVLNSTSIRPLEITDREIRLAGVHPAFCEAVMQMREDRAEKRDPRRAEEDEFDRRQDDDAPRLARARRVDSNRGDRE